MRVFAFLLLLLPASWSFAQTLRWVTFTDKGPEAAALLARPGLFLSPEAIARRHAAGINHDFSDLPVYRPYLQALQQEGGKILMVSRWFNAALVEGSEAVFDNNQPFLIAAQPIMKVQSRLASLEAQDEEAWNYGQATLQLEMLGLPDFHAKGFDGKGVRIAVLDAGFPGVDTLTAFASLRQRQGIVHTWDFVDDTANVYGAAAHGTRVLSTMAAWKPGEIIGSAPGAAYLLFRTEDARREIQVEEFYWLAAVERADSLGVDLIHSSLGYNHFQDSPGYEYTDMNGDRAIVTKAADMAAAKGILVVTSAGNEGRSTWRHITAPCDADSILCVGSVTRWHDLSTFSSVGPTADGRIKPDVVAMGTATVTYGPSARTQLSNGTSFAAPITAGLAACLWQAHRHQSNMAIIQAIRLSGDQAGRPDSDYGYGIPNVIQADSLLRSNVDLFSLTIAQRSKPARGQAALEARPQPAAEGARLSWRWDALNVIVTLPAFDQQVSKIRVQRGRDLVLVNPNTLKREGPELWFDTERWLPGEYEIVIEALDWQEKVTFSVPRG